VSRPFRPVYRLLRAVSLAAVLSVAGSAAAAPLTLRLGTLVPSGTSPHTELQRLAESWDRDSKGAVRVILYPDGRLGGESEMVRKMRIRQLNAAVLTVVGLSEIDPGVAGLQLMPLLFRDWAELDYVREQLRPKLEERLRAKGFETLFWADGGWVHFFSKQPGRTPDDFRKMKVFAWSGDGRQAEIMQSVGYRPVSLETSDIVLGLNTDMINAVPLPPMLALAAQISGPAPHMLEVNWAPIVGAAVIRTDAWAKLSPQVQAVLRASAEATGARLREISRRETQQAVEAMQARGLTVHRPTAEDSAAWDELARTVYPKVRGNLVPAEIFDEVMRHIAEYRARPAAP
jgi:TRAP-type transport system periplasmic protein